jgi:hypothetical protein
MPDYRAIIGERNTRLAELFDSLLISTSDPTDVIATNMAGRSARGDEQIRDFLAHPLADVDWVPARGGALGKRRPSALLSPRDTRVFLMPFTGWTILTKPEHLGLLVEPRSGALDLHNVPDDELPEWVTQVRKVEAQAGVERGPAVVMSLSGLPDEIRIYDVELPGPDRVSLAVSFPDIGMLLQGTFAFSSAERAEAFVTKLEEARTQYLDSRFGRGVLHTFHAFNAVKNLWLSRSGRLVSYGTSISNADGKAMTDKAAEISHNFYSRRPWISAPPTNPPSSTPAPAPAPSTSPQ